MNPRLPKSTIKLVYFPLQQEIFYYELLKNIRSIKFSAGLGTKIFPLREQRSTGEVALLADISRKQRKQAQGLAMLFLIVLEATKSEFT